MRKCVNCNHYDFDKQHCFIGYDLVKDCPMYNECRSEDELESEENK